MRTVIQRVSEASVSIDGEVSGRIGHGLLVLLGVTEGDDEKDIDWLCKKITQLRIFNDDQEKMNLSVTDTGGDILVVSQFTLYADCKKGNRPSYIRSAHPEIAIPLYEHFVTTLGKSFPGKVETGVFGAMMEVSLVNAGPVTIILDSKEPSF